MSDQPKIKSSTSNIELKVSIQLSEIEVRALLKIAQYGSDPYIKWFTENLSRYELDGLKSGVRSLFNTIRNELPPHIRKVDKAREILKDN